MLDLKTFDLERVTETEIQLRIKLTWCQELFLLLSS